jgi:H+/gluconate symporter-like permease
MTERTEPLPTREEEPLTPHRKAVGHPMAGAYWAVLNMFCLALTLYTVIPLHVILSRFIKRRKENKEQPKENEEKKKLSRKNILLRISLIGVGACSLILFIATEDLHKPMQVIDIYTFPMILLLIAVWFIRKKLEKAVTTPNP